VASTLRIRPIPAVRALATDAATRTVGEFGNWLLFSCQAVARCLTDVILRLRYRKEVARHMSDIVVGAGAYVVGGGQVFVIAAMALAVGGTLGVQVFSGLQSLGAESYTGLVGAYINIRELAPIIAAISLAAQVGSSFTAEIGAMRISEEIDALETMAVPPLVYLVSTRLVAVVLAIIPLYTFTIFFMLFSTRFVTTQFFGMSPGLYDHYSHAFLPTIDVLYSLIKVVVFSVIIVLVHTYYGYFASGGPVGVGRAVGKAIRSTIVWIVLVNLLLTVIFWGPNSTVNLIG
jgi:phospholipid/cholesterol/gamma-HCH transport system permease protein